MTTPALDHEGKFALLRESPLFSRLARPDLSHIALQAEHLTIPPGGVLTSVGAAATFFYLFISGAVTVSWVGAVDLQPQQVPFAGWAALVEPYRSSTSIVAFDECTVLRLRSRMLLDMFSHRPDVGYDVMRAVAAEARARLEATVQEVRELRRQAAAITPPVI